MPPMKLKNPDKLNVQMSKHEMIEESMKAVLN